MSKSLIRRLKLRCACNHFFNKTHQCTAHSLPPINPVAFLYLIPLHLHKTLPAKSLAEQSNWKKPMYNIFSSCFSLFFFSWLSLLVTVSPALTAPADQQSLASNLIQVQNKYQKLESLGFSFSQTSWTSGRARTGKGDAVFYRPTVSSAIKQNHPGIMRWNYLEPEVQIILNDGKELSIYTQQDKQLIVTSAEELQSDITYSFFSGKKNLLDNFEPIPADPQFGSPSKTPGHRAIQLTPRQPHNQIKRVQLWYDSNFIIHKLIIEDHFDAITELVFTNVQLNRIPPDDTEKLQSLLHLDLAPDTEIIRQ